MNIIPQDILAKYKGLTPVVGENMENVRHFAAKFADQHTLTHHAASVTDPLAGNFFHWRDPAYPRWHLEVVGQLDDKVSYVVYEPHWIFNSKQAHLEARVDLIRAFCKVRGADLSRVEGLLIRTKSRGRATWTGELLTVELVTLLQLGLDGKFPKFVAPENAEPKIVLPERSEESQRASDSGFVTADDLAEMDK